MAGPSKPNIPKFDLDVFSRLRRQGKAEEAPEIAEMRRNRAVNRRTASAVSPGPMGASVNFATGRPRDPLFYWKQNNLPYDLYNHEELKKVRAYSRLLYQTHPLIGSCVDIYTKYPLERLFRDAHSATGHIGFNWDAGMAT